MEFRFDDVNDAFRKLVAGIQDGTIPTVKQSSRYGHVLRVDEPVLIHYTYPQERVLVNAARDCNPFFHLYEAMWMLAGRRDVAPLVRYNKRMEEFSDDGAVFHGAYGYRWRKHFGYDQLKYIIDSLREDALNRRVVLQMWDATEHPYHTVCGDPQMVAKKGKDVPCNTQAYFSIRHAEYEGPEGQSADECYLDMTVCNRSNDMIWGMLGANYVQYSFLQEYLARCIGVKVGLYRQFTNNLHVYTDRWEPDKWLADASYMLRGICCIEFDAEDDEIEKFVDATDYATTEGVRSKFLRMVGYPMLNAYWRYKQGNYVNAIDVIDTVGVTAWRLAGRDWLRKRIEKRREKDYA